MEKEKSNSRSCLKALSPAGRVGEGLSGRAGEGLSCRLRLLFVLLLCATTAMAQGPTFKHPWAGKRVAFFGDSVTDPAATGIPDKYWTFLASWLDIKPLVYAVNGREWNDIPRQTEALYKDHGNNVDAIVILMGTNDFNSGVPIGQWFNETTCEVEAACGQPRRKQMRRHRTPVMDPGTLCGRINIALQKLRNTYPDKQIVLLTPMHRAYAEFSDSNVQPDESYANSCGEFLSAYTNAVCEASKIWAVPVIDLADTSTLLPTLPAHSAYFHDSRTDRLHPNKAGHERMARALFYQLATIWVP